MIDTTQGITKDFFEAMVELAKIRVRRAYDLAEGDIFLSFSGGKDSTVVAELIKMANLPTKIPFVFANTGIELDATLEFVKQYDYENIQIIKPRKPFGQILQQYGVPALSKAKSQFLSTYQRAVERGQDPQEFVCVTRLLGTSGDGRDRLAKKHYHFLHPDHEYKITNKCCQYLKKYPFEDYAKDNDMKGTFVGVRVAEGGVRASQYKTCTMFRKRGSREELLATPIYDWSDEMVDMFISTYNVQLSKAYTDYGFTRTGCIGCPFSKELPRTLPVLKEKEPLKYKAVMKWLGAVYMDMGIKLEEDEEYMKNFEERQILLDSRREEMLEQYGKKS